MDMKRWPLLTGLFVSLVLAGCVGTTSLGVLDDSVPEESQCPLEIRNNMAVILYDNQPVEWGAQGLTKDRAVIGLPPGEHTFIVRWLEARQDGFGHTTTITKTATVDQEFLAGHSYRIYQQRIWLLFVTIVNVKCKDVTPRNKLA